MLSGGEGGLKGRLMMLVSIEDLVSPPIVLFPASLCTSLIFPLRFSSQILERLVTDWCGVPAPQPSSQQPGSSPTSPSGTVPHPSPAPSSPPPVPSTPELVPGFRRFAIESFACEACVAGLLRAAASALFDARDVATVTLFGEVRCNVTDLVMLLVRSEKPTGYASPCIWLGPNRW